MKKAEMKAYLKSKGFRSDEGAVKAIEEASKNMIVAGLDKIASHMVGTKRKTVTADDVAAALGTSSSEAAAAE